MFKWMYRLAAVIVGYLIAAAASSAVSVTFAATVWGSAWTWFVLVFWIALSYITLWLWPFIAAGLGALVGIIGLFSVAITIDKFNAWKWKRERAKLDRQK